MVAPNDSGHLKTQANELVKQHTEYDDSNRAEYIYTAPSNAVDGTPCSVVRFAYSGLSPRVAFMKEYTGNWNDDWDVF